MGAHSVYNVYKVVSSSIFILFLALRVLFAMGSSSSSSSKFNTGKFGGVAGDGSMGKRGGVRLLCGGVGEGVNTMLDGVDGICVYIGLCIHVRLLYIM